MAIVCRNILLIALFSGWSITGYGQQSPQAVFDQANENLNSANYRQAIALYKNLEEQNTVSGALYLNLGISYQRIDSLGRAKFYFLKASQFEETESKAEEALKFIESQFSRQSAVLPKLPWDIATDWLQHNLGATNLLLTGIIFLNLGVLIFIGHWFFHWQPSFIRAIGITAISISVLIIALSFYTRYVNERYSTAVMVTEKVPVRENPQAEASLVSNAFEGYTFTVDHYRSKDKPAWSYVRMSNGLYGWIPNSEILIL